MSKFRLLRITDVMAITGLSRSVIYQKAKQGTFPTPRQLGPRAVAWRSDEIDAWLESLPEAGDRAHADNARAAAKVSAARRSTIHNA